MDISAQNLKIVLILTIGFAFASLLGYITHRCKLSPILGYLIAGYLIGPYSPGFVADLRVAEQLAEIGVILMMFGVGLHFKWEDLINVKNIAIPGAIGQTLIATALGALFIYQMGWPLETGIVIGLAIGVASTVVLIHVLSDNGLLHTPQGHVAVGWLIVEDILTVLALLIIPALAARTTGSEISLLDLLSTLGIVFVKFIFLALFLFTVGRRLVTYALNKVEKTHSHELFIVTILAFTFVIATGSTLLLGTSIALGAFIAGMVIGQTDVRQRASKQALPIQDAFLVIFFLAMGMLFNPYAIAEFFPLFLSILAIILVAKPLAALIIIWILRQPFKTALIVALGLAQIGEFSFILAEEALQFHLLPDAGYDIIVACALVSIAINPLLFKLIAPPKINKQLA